MSHSTVNSGLPRRRSRGFVLITMVVSSVALLACTGMAIDAGHLQLVKVRMQTAADAAAVGGTQEAKQNGAAHVTDAARADAALNGFPHGQNGVTVTVNTPPTTGYYTGDPTAVEVLISQNVGTFFMSILGFRTSTVRARGVARLGSSSTCMFVLDKTANAALQASGGVAVQVNCGVMVNSSSSSAMQASGGAHVNATSFRVVGNYSSSGGGYFAPAPVIHATVENDPLTNLAPPAVGACNVTNYSASGGVTTNIGPGVYCGGISISGGSRVTMQAGTYILLGGGMSVSGGSTLTASGVTFYNTYGTGHSYGAISLSGGTYLTLSAPTSGPLAGILFFQDRTLASGAASSFSGGTSTIFNGALYFPTTSLSYSGGMNGAYTILVAKTISFSGGSTVNSDYSSLVGGSPVKGTAALSE